MKRFLHNLLDKIFFCNDEFELLENEHGYPVTDFLRPSHGTAKNKKDSRRLFTSLSCNIAEIEKEYRSDISKDLIIRKFRLCRTFDAAVCFINGMTSSHAVNDFILRDGMAATSPDTDCDIADYAHDNVFSACDIKKTDNFHEVYSAIADGLCVVLIDKSGCAIIADTRKYPDRSVSSAENEKGVFGPRESFIENIRTNISLIRRHVHTDDLVCEMRNIGEDAKTSVGILYREGTANPSLVCEVKRRLSNIRTRSVLSTGIVSQMMERHPLSPLPQTLMTERPDRCASYLLEGHIVILCDGSPMASVLPATLFTLMSTAEDVYARQLTGNVMRIIRWLGALMCITLPGLFISVVMYHQGFLSSEMLATLISSRKMVFIPIGIELLMLLFVFQLIREAGMRVPGSIGQAIGIIGGLVLGQAVVSANLASSIVLILVALTGLGTFSIPDYSTQLCAVYFRLIFVFAGWMGGFLGFSAAFLLFIGYLCSLKSFGVPFLAPFSPKTYSKRQGVTRGRINNGNVEKEDDMQ